MTLNRTVVTLAGSDKRKLSMPPRLIKSLSGYILCLCSWLILTLAAPLSAALGVTEAGWMRLCSAQGVHWVALPGERPAATVDDRCTCLSSPLVASDYPTLAGPVHAASPDVPILLSVFNAALVARAQPRAPPTQR